MDSTKQLRENGKVLEEKLKVLFAEFYRENGDVNIAVISDKEFAENNNGNLKLVRSSVFVELTVIPNQKHY